MNKYGSTVLSYLLPIIESLITMRTLRTVEEQEYIASNLISICESGESKRTENELFIMDLATPILITDNRHILIAGSSLVDGQV